MITSDTVTLDDTLRAELDATAEMYWRWATRDDALAYLCNDLSRALDNVLYRLAPEGTDGQAFSSWVRQTFHDCHGEPNRRMTDCMALALLPGLRAGWDVTFVVCDYCGQAATRVTDSDEPLCDRDARDHYGPGWRTETRVLGERARARITMSD